MCANPSCSVTYIARPLLVDPMVLDRLDILWGISYLCGERHIVMSVLDWRRAAREGAIVEEV